jgi:flagellar hook-associated protein 3 FlgL
MRVTEGLKYQSTLAGQTKAAERLDRAARRATSGLRVERPSDDPSAFSAALRNDARAARLEARQGAMARARDGLALAESALAAAGDVMSAAQQLAVAMAGDDMAADDRAVAAQQVAAMRQQLLGLANAAGPEGRLFGGTRAEADPFTAAGAFVGNDEAVPVELADGVSIAANASGARAFAGANGGRDVFADLAALEAALAGNDRAAVGALLDPLERGRSQVVAERSKAGLGLERLTSAAETTESARTVLARARTGLVEADAPTAYSELVNAQGSYDRALAVAKKILSMPLPDF